MKKTWLILPAVLLLAAGCGSSATSPTSQTTQPTQQTQNAQPQQQAPASQKFVDQSYYKNTYLVSGNNLSADAKKALSGFTLTQKAMADGSVQYTFKAEDAEYHDQQYVVKKGEQLYFIERFLGDDNAEKNEEKNMKDDTAVVVDAQGNVVDQPTDWSR